MSDEKKKRSRRWPWLVVAAVAAGVVVTVVRRSNGGEKAIDSSLITTAKKGDLEIAVIETGKVQPREKVEVKSKVAGQVEKVLVVEGERVCGGRLQIRIDTCLFNLEEAR